MFCGRDTAPVWSGIVIGLWEVRKNVELSHTLIAHPPPVPWALSNEIPLARAAGGDTVTIQAARGMQNRAVNKNLFVLGIEILTRKDSVGNNHSRASLYQVPNGYNSNYIIFE
jgi:hypothetical protein